MALDDRTAREQLTPEERRELLRAFADRMLLKVTAMDDPEDLPGVEKAMRVAAVIERVYSRCDRAERQIRDKAPDPRKLEAERAIHETAAIKARVSLANTLKWGEERRRDLGSWWDAAQTVAQAQPQPTARKAAQAFTPPAAHLPQSPAPFADKKPAAPPHIPKVSYIDDTDGIRQVRADLALKDISEASLAALMRKPPPPA